MTAIQTPFASKQGRYAFLGSMLLENAYTEVQGDGGKAKLVILPCDGLIQFGDDAGSQCRGAIFMEDLDATYSVHSSSVWKFSEDGTTTRIGTIPGIDRVQLTRNKKSTPQITIRCDAGLYYIESDVVRIINSSELPSGEVPVSIETLGEYTLLGYEDGRVFFSTQGETTEYDALSFFTAEQLPDNLKRLFVDRGELFIFGGRSIEVWPLTGQSVDAPFTFRTIITKGISCPDSVVALDGTLMWAGHDDISYRLEGYTPKRISDHEVERLIHNDTDKDNVIGFAWAANGHSFYTLKGQDWTQTFDAATGFWHSRKSRGIERWRVQYAIPAWGKTIVGDELTGKLFYLDSNTYTEDGGIMTYRVRTPHMHVFPRGGVVDAIFIDFLAGQGVTSSTAQGFNPILMLRYSDDGGNTWSSPRHISMGRQGQYETRIRSRRLGRFKDKGRVWEISVSDPVGRALANLDATVRPIAA